MQITKFFSILIISSLFLIGCANDDDNSAVENAFAANRQAVGSSANDLLSDTNYKGLTIEIVSVQGHEPTEQAITSFRTFLEERLFKPDGIAINQRSIPSSNAAPFSIEEIAQIERKSRTLFNQDDKITVFIYFADGSQESDTTAKVTLGAAYLNTSIVIYENTLRALSNRIDTPMLSTIEAATLHHEFAHLLGLVNLGTPLQSQHEDSNSKGHCNVKNCLMEAAIEFETGMMDILGKGIPKLDPLCIADLKANGGR